MTKQHVLDMLSSYTGDMDNMPAEYYSEKLYYFIYDAYVKWSMEMIEDYILKSRNYVGDGLMILEELAHKMDVFACQAKTDEARIIFSTAYDVVMDFIGFVIMEDGGL